MSWMYLGPIGDVFDLGIVKMAKKTGSFFWFRITTVSLKVGLSF